MVAIISNFDWIFTGELGTGGRGIGGLLVIGGACGDILN